MPARKLTPVESTKPVPKNGEFYVAHIVGGVKATFEKTQEALWGSCKIAAYTHWAERSNYAGYVIPKNCDLVIVNTAFVGHDLRKQAEIAAGRAGIPLVGIPKSWATTMRILLQNGWREPSKPGRKKREKPPAPKMKVVEPPMPVITPPVELREIIYGKEEAAPPKVTRRTEKKSEVTVTFEYLQKNLEILNLVTQLRKALDAQGYEGIIVTSEDVTMVEREE